MKQKSQIGEQYNIARCIIRAAEARGLDAMATGGGFDYITRQIGDESNAPRMILGCADDAGSPDTLCEKANVTLYLNDEHWEEDFISFNFETAVEAMDFMAGFDSVTLNMAGVTDDSCRACGHKLGTSENCLMCEAHLVGLEEAARWAHETRAAVEALAARPVWSCPTCHRKNQSDSCGNCGTARPTLEGVSLVQVAKKVVGFRDTDQANGITPEPAQGWDNEEGGAQ